MPVDVVRSGCRGQYAECSAGLCRECAEVLILALRDLRDGQACMEEHVARKSCGRCGAGWTISSSHELTSCPPSSLPFSDEQDQSVPESRHRCLFSPPLLSNFLSISLSPSLPPSLPLRTRLLASTVPQGMIYALHLVRADPRAAPGSRH